MQRNLRFGAAIVTLLIILFLGRQQEVGAIPEPSAHLSLHSAAPASDLLVKKDDCKDPKNKDKKRCRGTVKPPPKDVIIPVTGQYSVGGLCTLNVEWTDPAITLNATLVEPLPGELPKSLHKARQGCLLTYYRSGQVIPELEPASGTAAICFAATPAQQMLVYFYDWYSADPIWAPLPDTTALPNGIICGPANASGVYIATFTP
jgi:hypothetical protein